VDVPHSQEEEGEDELEDDEPNGGHIMDLRGGRSGVSNTTHNTNMPAFSEQPPRYRCIICQHCWRVRKSRGLDDSHRKAPSGHSVLVVPDVVPRQDKSLKQSACRGASKISKC
jgi:hypothetical protein